MRADFDALTAFVAVATDRSFTRAAARLGVSQSALSRTVRKLEEELGIRLLTRTTRKVATTEAGSRLLATVAPRFAEIETEIAALSALRDKPAGTVRITSSEYAARIVVWPKLTGLLLANPDIRVEIVVDNGFTDIVAHGLDAGVRLGESIEKDMVAVRIAPDTRLVAVASRAYFRRHPVPDHPHELTAHRCINLRLVSSGAIYAWEFQQDGGRALRIRVDGQLTFNTIDLAVDAALRGFGVAFLPEEAVRPYVQRGKLVQVLDRFCPTVSGFHLYYPSRRQNSPAFQAVVDALRQRD